MRKYLLISLCCLIASVSAEHLNSKHQHHQNSKTSSDVNQLVAAMMQQTPVIDDLKTLTDQVGARLTGSKANLAAVDWAIQRFEQAGVKVKKEAFTMPRSWFENSTTAHIEGDGITFTPGVLAQPFTYANAKAMAAPLVNLHHGLAADFARQSVKDKWVLVYTDVLDDTAGMSGLFSEYVEAPHIEKLALQHQVKGLIYMSSRPKNMLYRHLPSTASANQLPIILMEREHALRTQRLLDKGHQLIFSPNIDTVEGGQYQSFNVVAEITGSKYPDQYVVIGAHIDSFDLGTGALDNGSNSVIMIDLARQIKRLGLQPKRTMRFVLYNGEEQGLYGSWAYTKTHADELDNTVMTATMDVGTGRVNGFFTNGRADIIEALNQVLAPVAALGPFTQVNQTLVGTDNYDFMMQGVPNLVANQTDANYASNYHGESDTFDKVDQRQLKLNSAIAAAMIYGFANLENITWRRQTAKEVLQLVKDNDVESQMTFFGLLPSWLDNSRGIKEAELNKIRN
ncbi:MAG: carboxypeptidase Q [Phenylobacterium sp.]|jgi:carboxypeptidase Q